MIVISYNDMEPWGNEEVTPKVRTRVDAEGLIVMVHRIGIHSTQHGIEKAENSLIAAIRDLVAERDRLAAELLECQRERAKDWKEYD